MKLTVWYNNQNLSTSLCIFHFCVMLCSFIAVLVFWKSFSSIFTRNCGKFTKLYTRKFFLKLQPWFYIFIIIFIYIYIFKSMIIIHPNICLYFFITGGGAVKYKDLIESTLDVKYVTYKVFIFIFCLKLHYVLFYQKNHP